ncbi:3-methyl-2-oxobutanoate hydroxymethyltransferase [Allobacillus sp. GCM10007491]|uniref:3-methyl-2-oxobutanoate hydroxymethyltransferase n=1 Tax=Allobacillus saliphilus TaxID=2912308 RepID=A0A941CSQ6_9BACI|nr:3-methyl-2-oxobutanoate hydroxymethyltransferase [Allobacillus saliphilus]MBR7553232.1 3-methyl-2-oxobutanoate hydroxymethyltransferase [Allobacillus saliphilus]
MKTRRTFEKMKQENEKITMLTAYDYPSAKTAENAGVDMILVGDSLGMVVLGYDSTIPVTVDDMIHHGKAVKRGAPNTFTVVDLPFMSFHVSEAEAMRNAARIVQETGADAVKLEGGQELAPLIRKLTQAGIPVVGHIGLTPQTFQVLGGYRVQGKTTEEARRLIENADVLNEAGVISIVLECVPAKLATLITENSNVPTIGIGAGSGTDGQVLVYHDLLQYGVERLAKFVKPQANLNESIDHAIRTYISEVKATDFPSDEHTYAINDDVLDGLYGGEK